MRCLLSSATASSAIHHPLGQQPHGLALHQHQQQQQQHPLARSSGVNAHVGAIMSQHLRQESSASTSASTSASAWHAAGPSRPGSSASSYTDVRLAKGRSGEVGSGGANGSTVRRRRLASEDMDNPWDWSASSTPEPASHPLAGPSGSGSGSPRAGASSLSHSHSHSHSHSRRGSDLTAEASRPALTRLTSETEREVEAAGIASRSSTDGASLRGSLDLLRSALKPVGEVEVLVHQVKPGESLQGIALQYGIDLPVLRKVNKLWASDPVSLRRELYVPLEACRWTKTSQTVVRGPEEGQITLVTRKAQPREVGARGKGKQREEVVLADLGDGAAQERDAARPRDIAVEGLSPTAEIPLSLRSLLADGEHTAAVHNILRVPASELAFFPKTTAKDKPGRQSLDTYFTTESRPVIPRSPSTADTLSAAAMSASRHTPGKPFVTVGAFRKPFSPPTMTPTGRGAIPNIRASGGRVVRHASNPSLGSGVGGLGQISNGITSKLSSLFIPPDSPVDSARTSIDSTPRTAGLHEAPYELAVRTPSADRPQTRGLDWFANGAPAASSFNRDRRTLAGPGTVKTTQPLREPAMSIPGKVSDRNHIDLGL